MSRVRIAFGLALLAGGTLPAQSIPALTKSKAAATHAVDATNAHTAAMTADQSVTPVTSAPKPASATPSTAGAPQGAAKDSSARAGRATESAAGSAAVPRTVEKPAPSFEREVFSYDRGGRRDPFISLMASGELRPVITDLVVAGIVFDASGRNSVAVLHDVSTKEQYRVHPGQTLGRMRVARIDPKSITFTIEEFGLNRQETLGLGDPNKVRKQ